MGRGGPAEPQVAEAGSVDVERLVGLVRAGEHAASDYLEDALTTGVTTIGARRAGGRSRRCALRTNVREAAELAVARGAGLVIVEGSGSAVPAGPVGCRGAGGAGLRCPPEYLSGYLGPYRLLLSDLAVVTMAKSPNAGLDIAGLKKQSENLSALRPHLRRYLGDDGYVVTDFTPVPLEDVRGKRAFFITTAPEAVAASQAEHLRSAHGCTVVGWSAKLADRAGLAEDLDAAQGYDVLLTELKAAAVDIGVERALARGAEVVFVDNRAVVVEGSADLDIALGEVIDQPCGEVKIGSDEEASSEATDGESEGIQRTAHRHLGPRAGPALLEGPAWHRR